MLVPDDYTDSWFLPKESTDMYGYTKATPDKVTLKSHIHSGPTGTELADYKSSTSY